MGTNATCRRHRAMSESEGQTGSGRTCGVPLLGVRSQLRLELAYIDGGRRSTKRIVWPLQLGFMESARVLVAWCELREGFRFFRTNRIQAAVAKERYPRRRVCQGCVVKSSSQYLKEGFNARPRH